VTNPQMEIKEKNKLEEALIRRIAVNPRDVEAYERLGDYYMESENFRDSHECFKQVLMLSPAHYKAKIRIRKIEKLIIM
jgi:lipoprotein NlpI